MGQLIQRMFENPLQPRPVCFYRQKDFTSMGEERNLEDYHTNGEFDEIHAKFIRKLVEIKAIHRNLPQQIDVSAYPGWDSLTVENLQSIFLLVTDKNVGQMNFHQFCLCLDSLCDKTPRTFRRDKFLTVDEYNTGWINFDQFLHVIYNFNARNKEGEDELFGLAKTCRDISSYIEFIESMSLGFQLQTGLF